MNILFITHHDNFYGSSRSLMNLLNGLKEYNIIPLVIVPKDGDFTAALKEHKISYELVSLPWWMTRGNKSYRQRARLIIENYKSYRILKKLVDEWGIDLVYTNSSVIALGRLIAYMKGLPHIWHVREFGDLDFNLQYILSKWLSRKFIKSSSAIICNSLAVNNYYFKNFKKKNVHIIYNGVATKEELDYLKRVKPKHSSESGFTFLIIGAISPKKGQEAAIRAFAEVKEKGIDSNLMITGSGVEEYVEYLKNLTFELGIADYVEFTGFLKNPYEAYNKADCVLMCSAYEAFGRVTAEAMSACLPVIGKNSGATPEIIQHEETGLLYDSFDELVDAMVRMVQTPKWSKKLGLAGWERAKKHYNTETYAENVFTVIEKVMKDKHGSI